MYKLVTGIIEYKAILTLYEILVCLGGLPAVNNIYE